MTAVQPSAEVARPAARTVWNVAEACLAAAAFAVLCAFVLRAVPYLPEPDDYAYRASIVAMTDGHFLTLSGALAHALAERLAPVLGGSRLGPGPGGGPVQWVQLPSGRWISEKDPGYPYLAVAFQALGLIRLAPLVYGALACLGLVRHLYLDRRCGPEHAAGGSVLRAGPGRHLAARRLAAGPRAAQPAAHRDHHARGGRGAVRAGRLGLP